MNTFIFDLFEKDNVKYEKKLESGIVRFKINDKVFELKPMENRPGCGFTLNGMYIVDDRISLIRGIQECYHKTPDECENNHLIDLLGIFSSPRQKIKRKTKNHILPKEVKNKPEVISSFMIEMPEPNTPTYA